MCQRKYWVQHCLPCFPIFMITISVSVSSQGWADIRVAGLPCSVIGTARKITERISTKVSNQLPLICHSLSTLFSKM